MFSVHPVHWFHSYSLSHWIVIFLMFATLGFMFFFREKLKNSSFRWLLIFFLVVFEIAEPLWKLCTGIFSVSADIPLQLCDLSLYLCIWMLMTKNYRIFEVVYFTTVGGSIQSILTPNLDYGFPHLLFFTFFITHAVIIFASFFMIWSYGFRPTFISVFKAFLVVNLYAGIIYIVDRLTAGDYMFLMQKPSHGSLIDFLGPYPWYILSLEGVSLFLFFILYIPFFFLNKKMIVRGEQNDKTIA